MIHCCEKAVWTKAQAINRLRSIEGIGGVVAGRQPFIAITFGTPPTMRVFHAYKESPTRAKAVYAVFKEDTAPLFAFPLHLFHFHVPDLLANWIESIATCVAEVSDHPGVERLAPGLATVSVQLHGEAMRRLLALGIEDFSSFVEDDRVIRAINC